VTATAHKRVLVRSAGGWLSSFDADSPAEPWRARVSKEDRIQLLPGEGVLLVLGAEEVRIHDWATGEPPMAVDPD